MKKRLNDLYQKFKERHGEERAKELMLQRGYVETQYLSEGGGVKDLVTAAGSALQNVGTRRGNPFTARNIGYGMGGHTGALIGEAGEIIGEGLYHGAQHGMKAGMTSAAAGYGAMVAADFVGEAASLAMDPTAAAKRYESANRRQANQGYLSNVGENLLNPGRAIMQIGKETAGLMDDVTSALRPGYKRSTDRSPGRRAQRRQFGGLIYADAGMMVPRGTDTVPAMLTPGEFVVNRQAAQANLPLLKSINSGVSYFKNGGEAEEKLTPQQAKQKLQFDKRMANGLAQQVAKDLKIPLQEAYNRTLGDLQAGKSMQEAGRGGAPAPAPSTAGSGPIQRSQSQANQQIPQISQRQQAMTAQASQAAFDPRNSGDVNKQLAIFGQVLTGVNQTLVQYGTVLQNLVGVQQQLLGGGGGQVQGETSGVSNGNGGLAEYTQKFGAFVESLKSLNIPEQINLVGQHTVNVNFAGAEQLGRALNEGNQIADFIVQRVQNGLDNWVNEELPGTKTPKL